MSDQSVADRENAATRSLDKRCLRVALPECGKPLIECGQLRGCSNAVSLRKGLERQVELRDQAQLRCEVAKADDVGPDRQCRQELRPLQRIGLVRQSREAAVHTVFPIVSWPLNGSRRVAAQVAQGQREQPSAPQCR